MKSTEIPYLATNKLGYYEMRWPDSGQTKIKSLKTKSLRDASRNYALQINGLINGGKLSPQVSDLLEFYRVNHVLAKADPATHERIIFILQNLEKFFSNTALNVIDPLSFTAYSAARRAGLIGQKAGDGTIGLELRIFRAALNFCAKTGEIKRDEIPYVPMPPSPPPRKRWLTKWEAFALMAAANERVEAFCVVALATGGRPDAIRDLTWDRVDFNAKLIYFNRKGRPETAKKRPTVPMSDALHYYLSKRPATFSDFVLGHCGEIRGPFNDAVRRAGLQGKVTPKTLRHTWATWAAQRGVSMFDIAGVLGDSVSTVEKTYAHHDPNYLRSAV